MLSGGREAELTALGVISGVHQADGVVGDLGGGSLELVDVHGTRARRGLTRPLGGLALADISAKSLKKAEKFVKKTLGVFADAQRLRGPQLLRGRRHLAGAGAAAHVADRISAACDARLRHCRRRRARIRPAGASGRCRDALQHRSGGECAAAAAGLCGAGAGTHRAHRQAAAGDVLRARRARGLLYSLLKQKDKEKDALIEAARGLNQLRSRSPRHGEELIDWTDRFMASSGLDETAEERRLRHAACLLADIGWRAHPDYRGEQSLNIIAHGGFTAIDHPGRAYLALAVFYRHVGLVMDDELSPRLRELASTRMLDRARVLGAALRLAYVVSAAMPGVLPKRRSRWSAIAWRCGCRPNSRRFTANGF